MKQDRISKGSRVVVICEDSESRMRFSARLYLNHGETPSAFPAFKGKTRQGAEAWARRMLDK